MSWVWDDTGTGDVTVPKEEWTLGRDELQLFYQHSISIPPTVPEVVRLLHKLEGSHGR